MMQTTTPTPSQRFAGRAASVCSQRNPGSVKSGLSGAWKSRCDDDIPSDESDNGDKRPFGPNMRTRIRKRRAMSVRSPSRLPMSSGMSWMSSTKSLKMESAGVNSSSCSNVTTEKNIKKALFPPAPNKSFTQVRPGPSGFHGAKSFHTSSSLGQRRGSTFFKSPPSTVKDTTRSVPGSNPVAQKTSSSEDWVLYSVWHPAWDVIWKCDNGKRPLSQNQYFRKLITEVLAVNTTCLDIDATIDLKVIKVQGIKEDSERKPSIIGALEVEASQQSHRKKKKYIKWNPAPDLLSRLLKYVVSTSDLIVQYKYPTTLQTENSKGKMCFIHITAKDGQQVDHFELSKMGDQVSAYFINYDYYRPKVLKCARTKKATQQPVNASSTVTVADGAASKNLANIVFGSPSPSSLSSSDSEPLLGTRSDVAVVVEHEQQHKESPVVPSTIAGAQPLSPLSEEIEDMEISDTEEPARSHNPLLSGSTLLNIKNPDDDFNLNSFISWGRFVPGPLRPKVKKPNRQYVYHTLAELAHKLNDSISEDVHNGVVPNMLIKHQCNVYGIVVEIKNQVRHENAYYVRISDDTMDSVLLRIHTGSEQNQGPQVELGNIIRVHRLTVQMEWDTGVSENPMVLSTAAHHNYVLFEQSKEKLQFYYNTCAKTITLSANDMKRVGELHLFKSQIDIPTNEEPNSVEQIGIAQVARHQPPTGEPVLELDSILVVPQSSISDSDGICGSDLASPCASDISIGEDDIQSNSSFALNESRILAISNSRSDESFFSATSELDLAGDNRPQKRSRKSTDTNHNLETVQLTNNSQNITFSLFKDLKRTNEPFSLLCQIVSLNEHPEGIWCLILKDMEETVPSGEFKQLQSSATNPPEFQLAINIKNGIGLEKRDLLSMLHDSQGTDESYFIPNVNVKGARPPYTLEIDGNSCEIRRYKHLIRFLEMDSTFNTRSVDYAPAPFSILNPHEGTSLNSAPNDATDVEKQQQVIGEGELHPIEVDANDSNLRNPSTFDENSGDGVLVIEEIAGSQCEGSSQSNYVTATPTPSHSPSKIDRLDSNKRGRTPTDVVQTSNPETHGVTVEEPWTGRLRGRRKPRQHYQCEDSFEC